MITKQPSNKTIWIGMTLLACVIAVTFAASEEQYGQDQIRSQQRTSQRAQGLSQGLSQAQSGQLCSADKLIGSEVKSSAAKAHDETMSREQTTDRTQQQRDRDITPQSTPDNYDVARDADSDVYGSDSDADAYAQKETLGTIEELIISNNEDTVSYVVINSDGQHYPVPWKAFDVKKTSAEKPGHYMQDNRADRETGTADADTETDSVWSADRQSEGKEQAIYLKLTKAQLRQAPSVSSVSVERFTPQLKQQIDSFYSQHTGHQISSSRSWSQVDSQQQQTREQSTQPAQGQTSERQGTTAQRQQSESRQLTASTHYLKATDVIGLDLQSNTEADLGSVEDLVIDTRQGQVAYGLVSFGGFLNVGEKIAAVPWSALTIEPQQEFARIDATEDKLNAVVIEQGSLAQLSQPQFARKVHDNFNAEPYWGVYGFVPGESREMTEPNQLQQHDQDLQQWRDQQQQQQREQQQDY